MKKESKNESCCNVAVTTSQSCSNATATNCKNNYEPKLDFCENKIRIPNWH